MGVQHDGDFDALLDLADKLVRLGGAHDARHILDAHGGDAHVLHLLRELCKRLDGVHGRLRIAYRARHLGAALQSLFGRDLDVGEVVQRVKDADDVDAVLHGLGDEHLHYLVGIVMIAEKILPAKEHLQLALRHGGTDLTEPLPRILVEIAKAAVEHRAAPALDAVVAGIVHLGQYARELVVRQTRRDERLICVAQHCFGKPNFHDFLRQEFSCHYRDRPVRA